ncbi:MAG: hypothetical protein ACSHXZ_14855 [Gammaproteobacteria bacterium]
MKKSSNQLAPESKALIREKRKAEFTATGRDWAAGIAAVGASALIINTGKFSKWEELAARKFQIEKVAPDWTLQQHIDYQQVIGMFSYFFLTYISLCIVFCFPRYLIFDSPLPAFFGKIGRLIQRVVYWLTSELRTRVLVCLKGEKAKDGTNPDAS